MPGIPLPAVKPIGSPAVGPSKSRPSNLFHDEALLTFFRRLTFTPDGSLLLAPAGQIRHTGDNATKDELTNTVYIYSRAGLSKPPVAHLPNQKKTAVAIRCSPVVFKLRDKPAETMRQVLEPPTDDLVNLPPAVEAVLDTTDSQTLEADSFKLPYRVVFAVATGDAVMIYDTQQQTPLAVLSNLHYATFTDLTWSNDGHTLIMTSTDGFCSVCVFNETDLGEVYPNPPFPKHTKREEMAQKLDFPLLVPNRVPSPARSNSMTSNTSNPVTRGSFSAPSPLGAGVNPLHTPPQTPAAEAQSSAMPGPSTTESSKRPLEDGSAEGTKKRRVQPTLLTVPTPE